MNDGDSYTSSGKQVLKNDEHFADAKDDEAAAKIADALNTAEWLDMQDDA